MLHGSKADLLHPKFEYLGCPIRKITTEVGFSRRLRFLGVYSTLSWLKQVLYITMRIIQLLEVNPGKQSQRPVTSIKEAHNIQKVWIWTP